MDQHTPGKVHWEIHDVIYPDGYIDRLVQEGGRVILRHASIRPMEPEDRRRIAACWNACEEAGIPTEALEAGVVRELVEALEALVAEIEWEIGEEKWGRDPDALPMARAVLAKARVVEARPEDLDYIESFNPKTVLALLDRIEALEQERDAARAEAERWKQQYEELRAGVERVVQDLHERAHATARDWQQSGHPYHDGASDAYYEAGMMVRRVLPEMGR